MPVVNQKRAVARLARCKQAIHVEGVRHGGGFIKFVGVARDAHQAARWASELIAGPSFPDRFKYLHFYDGEIPRSTVFNLVATAEYDPRPGPTNVKWEIDP